MCINRSSAAVICCMTIAASMALLAGPSDGRPSSTRTIVPGYRIGTLQLKSYTGQLPLGKPDASDAGMSHYHYLWISKQREHHQMRTYTTFAAAVSNSPINGGPGQTIESIRATSPFFHTVNGIAVGASLATVKRRFRHLRQDPDRANILIDSGAGIAFEYATAHPTAASRCVAITVFNSHHPQVFDAAQIKDLVNQAT